jgi:DNA-binding NarL/FixJ family response regulator
VTVRVLIVDDQAVFRRAARRVVTFVPGFEVAGEADCGETAIDAVRELRPDAVLMDVHLPGIDGTEATRRILADADAMAPIVLLLSTYDAADYAARANACGAAAYLSKADFSPAVMRAAWAAASPSRPTA